MFEQINLNELTNHLELKTEFTIYKRKHRFQIAKPTIEKMIRKYDIKHTDGAYNRALGNAIKHGERPIKCKIYIGSRGELLITIHDSGHGFDFQSMIEKFHKGKVYFKRHGKGARTYNKNKYSKVSWHDGGSTIAILYN
jgi:hypothetical protein